MFIDTLCRIGRRFVSDRAGAAMIEYSVLLSHHRRHLPGDCGDSLVHRHALGRAGGSASLALDHISPRATAKMKPSAVMSRSRFRHGDCHALM